MTGNNEAAIGIRFLGLSGPLHVAEIGHGDRTVVLQIAGHCAWVGDPEQARSLGQALIKQADAAESDRDE